MFQKLKSSYVLFPWQEYQLNKSLSNEIYIFDDTFRNVQARLCASLSSDREWKFVWGLMQRILIQLEAQGLLSVLQCRATSWWIMACWLTSGLDFPNIKTISIIASFQDSTLLLLLRLTRFSLTYVYWNKVIIVATEGWEMCSASPSMFQDHIFGPNYKLSNAQTPLCYWKGIIIIIVTDNNMRGVAGQKQFNCFVIWWFIAGKYICISNWAWKVD